MKNLLIISMICFCSPVKAQHSPYFFYEAFPDAGLSSKLHEKYVGKVIFGSGSMTQGKFNGTVPYFDDEGRQISYDHYNQHSEIYAQGTLHFTAVMAHSLKRYYHKYKTDPNEKKPDRWDSSKELPKHINSNNYSDGLLAICILINGDTAETYMISGGYQEWTIADDQLIYYKVGAMATGKNHYPVFEYIHAHLDQKEFEITVQVYLADYQGKSFANHGKDLLAEGTCLIKMRPEDVQAYKAEKLNRYKKPYGPYGYYAFGYQYDMVWPIIK